MQMQFILDTTFKPGNDWSRAKWKSAVKCNNVPRP